MPVTKYDLAALANNYFIATLTSPKQPVTPEVVDNFAWTVYNIILSIPTDPTANTRLLNYVGNSANYYGVDPGKAVQFLKSVPGSQDLFFRYIQDNYGIQGNAEIVQGLIDKGLKTIADSFANLIWTFLKPLLPLLVISIGAIYVLKKKKQ